MSGETAGRWEFVTLAPGKLIRNLGVGRLSLALASACILSLAAVAPAFPLELFGRKFFEAKDETIVVPDAQPYTLDLIVTGGDDDLSKSIRNASSLAREEERPPPGTAGLIARARGDYGRILAALYAQGYYGGSVRIFIQGMAAEAMRPDIELSDPAPVSVSVEAGPLFRFGSVAIDGMPAGPLNREDEEALDLEDWELTQGSVARSGAILDAEGRLLELWRQRGHPNLAH